MAELCTLCRQRGILTLVDGAHTLGSHSTAAVTWLKHADFAAANLHKWAVAAAVAARAHAHAHVTSHVHMHKSQVTCTCASGLWPHVHMRMHMSQVTCTCTSHKSHAHSQVGCGHTCTRACTCASAHTLTPTLAPTLAPTRYARADELGTPYAVTIDFDTLGISNIDAADPAAAAALKGTATLRERDSTDQVRLPHPSAPFHALPHPSPPFHQVRLPLSDISYTLPHPSTPSPTLRFSSTRCAYRCQTSRKCSPSSPRRIPSPSKT